jgi:hypothetical protein
VVRGVLGEEAHEVTLSPDEDVVKALHRAEKIHLSAWGVAFRARTGVLITSVPSDFEHCVERAGELGVAVSDQEREFEPPGPATRTAPERAAPPTVPGGDRSLLRDALDACRTR